MVRSRFQAERERERERESPPYVTGHPEDRNTALDETQDWITGCRINLKLST
jgi:hypothetical protein